MRNALAGFLVGSIAIAAVLLTLRCQSPPELPTPPTPSVADADRSRLAVLRLQARLRHPESLTVTRTKVLPWRGQNGIVEIDFEADGLKGRGVAQFWVRFSGGATEDVLPETIEGAVDDPFGLFAPAPSALPPRGLLS